VAVLGIMAAGNSPGPGVSPDPPPLAVPRPIGTAPGPEGEYAVAPPGRLRQDPRRASLLVVAERGGVRGLRSRVARHERVASVEQVGLASLMIMGRSVTAAAVRPRTYRRLAPEQTARMDAVWAAVARGELAVTHDLADDLSIPLGGVVPVGPRQKAPAVRVGAIATTMPMFDLVVNVPRGDQLGIPVHNALVVVLAANADPAVVRSRLSALLGRRFTVTDLAATAHRGRDVYAARLVGGSVATAVGSFRYRWFADGRVVPDRDWVNARIRTELVPILGRVTCHRVMLPQLRGALREIVDSGLAASIDPSDYGGCYAPRFIGRDPSRGLSLHTWGIAIDLNVATNQVGTIGALDRRVVRILNRWGFSWGGTWRMPDPMHFQLAALRR